MFQGSAAGHCMTIRFCFRSFMFTLPLGCSNKYRFLRYVYSSIDLISTSTMLPLLLIYIALSPVSAHPHPLSATEIKIDNDSIDPPSLPAEFISSTDPRCTSEISVDESSDGTEFNLVQRQSKSCPSLMSQPVKWNWENWADEGWNAPATLPEPNANDVSPPSGTAIEFCIEPLLPVLLSCTSPEVMYGGMMGLVLNCVAGDFRFCHHSIME